MYFENFIKKNGTPITVKKHDHIFMQGESDDNFYLLQVGLLKAYYVSEDGKESIKSFIVPDNAIGSLTSVYEKKKTSFNLVVLQDSQLIKIKFERILQATTQSHDIAQRVIELLLSLSMKKERREYELLSMSAEDRYLQLCTTEPRLIETVAQNDIARYIGITPVALSRIKKRLISKHSR